MTFPNKAGNNPDNDEVLRKELEEAGITIEKMTDFIQEKYEVKTSIYGTLGGWIFFRAWYYWVAEGPGIPYDEAMELQRKLGKVLRASGDCGCRGPGFWFGGLACGNYHVDTQDGLNALSGVIRRLTDNYRAINPDRKDDPIDPVI